MDFMKRIAVIACSLVLFLGSFFFSVAPAAAETYTVKMGADNGMLAFQPKELEISAGDVVKFVNNKLAPHNAVFEASAPNAASLSHKGLLYKPGDSFEVTFDEAGTYPFYCEPHRGAGMVGKIVVK